MPSPIVGEGQGEGSTKRRRLYTDRQRPPSLTLHPKGGGNVVLHYALGSHPNAISAPAVSVSQISDSGRNTFQPSRINWS
jgi:hypothetical protein